MKLIKILIAGLIFFGLSYIFLSQFDKVLYSTDKIAIHSVSDLKIIFSIIYGLVGLLAIILNSNISIKGLSVLILIISGLFVIEGFYIKWLLSFHISDNVITEINLNFKTIYYFPIIPFVLIILSFGLKQIKFKKTLDRLPIIEIELKPSIKRLFAFIIDWLIVIIIGCILSSLMFIQWLPLEIFIIMFVYRLSLEFSSNKTIGKSLLGLNIKRLDNSKIKFSNILIRNISRLTLIYWIPIINGKTGIHDRIAETIIE